MKFEYISIFDGNIGSGVNKKIISFVETVKSMGIDGRVTFLSRKSQEDLPDFIKFKKYTAPPFKGIKDKILSMKEFGYVIQDLLRQSNFGDILYIRGLYPYPSFVKILKNNRKVVIVLEIQTLVDKELKARGAKLFVLLDKLYSRKILKYVDGIVGVTPEIVNYYVNNYKVNIKRALSMGNGVNVDSIPLRKIPEFNGKELKMLIVANVSFWHGIDRVLEGMKNYNGRCSMRLTIAGNGKELNKIKEIVYNSNILKDKVSFVGFLSGDDLNGVFDNSHIAIGSLGVHREGVKYLSSLKLREYTARGIPFIYSGEDEDFHDNFKYSLNIPNDDSPVNMYDLIEFTRKIYENHNHNIEMRNYAFENLDWKIKIKKLVDFVKNLNYD